jgi:hypothetical protein
MNYLEQEECLGCLSLVDEVNEYGLCPKCEEEFQQLRKAIQDTQDSDLRQ